MPAARGGSLKSAKPQGKASPNAKRAQPAAARRAAAPQRASSGPISPRLILAAACAVVALALVLVLATGGRGAHVAKTVVAGVDARFGQAGFRLTKVHVEGASALATPDIIRAAGVYRHQPLLGMDLNEVRSQVEHVGWVKEAKVVRLLPDTLVLSVVERKQLAVWQRGGRTVVIDDKGRVIPEADPAQFPTLPLVVGQGGAEHAPEILPILAQRPQLMQRMEAFVRVDDRRWDLRLKDGALIQLPAVGEEDALMQLEELDRTSHVMTVGFDRIDLRNPDVVAVRPRGAELPVKPATSGT